MTIVALLGLSASPACAQEKKRTDEGKSPWQGKVVSVADGDTVTVLRGKERIRIRLDGVDTPEKRQAYGQKAKKFTLAMVAGKEVRVVPATIDRYGRTVARVHLGDKCLNKELVRAGLAWWYRKYSPKDKELAGLEAAARKAEKGLWSDPKPTAPWDWRRQQRGGEGKGATTRPAPEGHPAGSAPKQHPSGSYHGNVKSHVLHAPSCKHYSCKNCTAMFKTVEHARAAGYRIHKACVR